MVKFYCSVLYIFSVINYIMGIGDIMKKINLVRILILFGILFSIIGSTLALYVWYTEEGDRTLISFTA